MIKNSYTYIYHFLQKAVFVLSLLFMVCSLVHVYAPVAFAYSVRGDYALVNSDDKKVPEKVEVIVIDPGHGGRDPGAIGINGIEEKQVNLSIALHLERYLKRNGFKVFLTRDSDKTISLEERAQFVNKIDADLFISIHTNAHTDKSAHGYETFYLSDPLYDSLDPTMLFSEGNGYVKYDLFSQVNHEIGRLYLKLLDSASSESRSYSIGLADSIHSSLKTHIASRDRGVKRARFFVLRKTQMPAVLIEVGFISNTHEETQLSQDTHREKIACGIAQGVILFCNGITHKNEYIGYHKKQEIQDEKRQKCLKQ